MSESEPKKKAKGDSHWSKILQVNMDTNGIRHKKCIRMCRKFSLTGSTTCRLGLNKSVQACRKTRINSGDKSGNMGIISSITARMRRWIQSKRKYEVSPVHEAAAGEKQGKVDKIHSGCMSNRDNKCRSKADVLNEDYLIISQASNYHPELKRSEGLKSPAQRGMLVSSLAGSSCGRVPGASSISRNEKATQISATYKGPMVNINIEFADQGTPTECRSQFAANPLRLNQRQLSQTSIMTPTRTLSRSQQLRQSRNKYIKLLQKAGQLSPGRSPLTGTISAPAKPGLEEKSISPVVKRRQIKTWPLACRKQLRAGKEEVLLSF
ncbi:unnamed protein product [Candidula unifasciata]|uniref:Uncharacterized protein n=1 Tax=Candidula unifasciata TaxID=100452 RepID=A0A8S3ZKP9_9EUPU|nr:unnamed protein product [Candidula unifasciata]